MTDINELIARMKAAAHAEIMCREACDTSDLWQEEASPENVLELTEALEAKEKQRAAANKVVIQQDVELHELRQSIAELEARTLTVKLPEYRNSPDMHTKQFYEAIGFNQGLDACIEAILAAGIKLQIEGE